MESFYEVSFSTNESLRAVAERHTDDDRSDLRDPFELVADKEEEEGCPLVHSRYSY